MPGGTSSISDEARSTGLVAHADAVQSRRWSFLRSRPAHVLLFVLIVVSSSAVSLRDLGHPYIRLWDEAVHVVVVRNLVVDCCTPKLHHQAFGADQQDWTDNYVWLHKPPLPFFVQAFIARLIGTGLFQLRLSGLLLAELLVVLVFWIGARYFESWIGVLSAAVVAFNHYTYELVQGRQFSGIPDLALACALLGVLCCLLEIVRSPRPRHYVWFGVLSGVAFLCKDGLSLIPFCVLALARPSESWRRHAVGVVYAAASAALVILPVTVYIAYLFPTEALHEQEQRLGHLLWNVEGWARPFDFYWTVYFPRIISPLIAGASYLSAALGLTLLSRDPRLRVMSLWVGVYLFVLSFGVSKVSNFIYPTVPVVALLLPATAAALWRQGRYELLVGLSASVIVTAGVFQWHLFDRSNWLSDFPRWQVRPALILLQGAVAFATVAALRFVRLPKPALASTGAATLAIALAITASINANVAAARGHRRDYDRQMALRNASLTLHSVVSDHDIVLVQWPSVRKSHLYVMYWSGIESFEVTRDKPMEARIASVARDRRVFLLRDSSLPRAGETRVSTAPYDLVRLR